MLAVRKFVNSDLDNDLILHIHLVTARYFAIPSRGQPACLQSYFTPGITRPSDNCTPRRASDNRTAGAHRRAARAREKTARYASYVTYIAAISIPLVASFESACSA